MSDARKNIPGERVPFFGPVTPLEATAILDNLGIDPSESKSLRETFFDFFTGEIGPNEFIYEIQVIAENEEARLNSKTEDSMDARDRASMKEAV